MILRAQSRDDTLRSVGQVPTGRAAVGEAEKFVGGLRMGTRISMAMMLDLVKRVQTGPNESTLIHDTSNESTTHKQPLYVRGDGE